MAKTSSKHRSGFVTVVGRPNVGKSTLINALLGQKVAAVSPRPQTTRRRQLGILTRPEAQIILIDTPGLHKPHHRLGEFMNEEAGTTLDDADVIVFLVDASQPPEEEDQLLASRISERKNRSPVILALNKIDIIRPEQIKDRQEEFLKLAPDTLPLPISAASRYNLDWLLKEINVLLPEGPPLYEPEQITDLYERDIAADLVREAALLHLRDEVPHSVAVRVDEYKERGETGAYILATIFVERESHKPIVIGKEGEMLKKIGSSARKEIEAMSGRKVFLELRVKVQKNWRSNESDLKAMGFYRERE